MQGCNPAVAAVKRIEQWTNGRILELRQKIAQLRAYKPSNRIGARMRDYQLARAEIELDHWLYFLGEDE
jgi:hypothetical protein